MHTNVQRRRAGAPAKRSTVGCSLKRVYLVAALALLASLAFSGSAVAGHQPACGELLTHSTTLSANLGPCPNDGVIIDASNVDLNLGGFQVLGGNFSGSPAAPGNAGVLFNNVTGSTVRNGQVKFFNSGVVIDLGSAANSVGSGNTVDGVTVEFNFGSLLTDFGEGVTVRNSDGNTIKNSTVGTSLHDQDPITVGASGNGPYAGITLLGDSDYNRVGVAGGPNQVAVNIQSSGSSNQDDGIRLEPDYAAGTYPNNNTIENNTVKGNALDGISVLAGPGTTGVSCANTIKNNKVRNNGWHPYAHRKGDGIRVFVRCNGNAIDGNDVKGNAASGIRVDSTGNTITNNSPVSGNCQFPDPQRPCFGSPLIPTVVATPQGADLYDQSGGCAVNTWSGNPAGSNRYPACIS